MSLFKIFRGNASKIPSEKHDGYMYYTKDDSKMYIDSMSSSGTLQRKELTVSEADNAKTVNGHTVAINVPSNAVFTDTTYSAGTGISFDGRTINNSGVRSISEGTTNGAFSVNTNGTTRSVKVHGLGSAAYTDSGAYAASSHTHTGDQVILTDTTTGTRYKLVMTNGKLTVETVS